MGRAHYLTIRCPTGCEAWLQPSALDRHLGRCRQHPWVDDLIDSVVIPAPLAPLLLSVLPEDVVDEAEHPEVGWSRRNDVGFDFRFGRRIRSPLEGVPARRWLYVATAVLEEQGLRAVQRSLTIDGFGELEEALLAAGDTAECATCGEVVTRRGMECHRATNTACRWRRAAHEVREAWEAGWRDPFNVAGAPLTWGELTARMRWKKRLLTVDFPRWTAVLLKAEVSPAPSGSRFPGTGDCHPQADAPPSHGKSYAVLGGSRGSGGGRAH